MAAAATGARQLTRLAREVELAEPDHLEARALVLRAALENPTLSGSSRDVNILLVEDDAEDRELIGSHLSGPTHTMHLAVDAEEAAGVLEAVPIDIIVLDLMLPDRDGRDFLSEIRERPGTAAVPVIVVSGMGGSIARAECLALGADAFLAKPADRDELQDIVARLLRPAKTTSRVDPATGLANRAAIREEIARIEAVEGGRGTPLCVAIIDLGGLAGVVDGHLLAPSDRVAISLAESLPGGALVGRWMGMEFVAVLTGVSSEAADATIMDKLQTVLTGAPFRDTDVSVTCGVIQVDAGVDIRDALVNAPRTVIFSQGTPDSPASGAGVLGSRAGLPIMLVEEDEVTARLVEHRLAREDMEVLRFRTGAEARRALEAGDFSLAILDVQVAGTDGFDLLETLTSGPEEDRFPVVVLTAMGSEADVIRGLDLGASDYMLKPFSPSELIARVRRLLRRGGR